MNINEELAELSLSIAECDRTIAPAVNIVARLKAQRMALVARERYLSGLVAQAVDSTDVDGGQPDDIDVWEQDQYNSDVELMYRTDVSS